MVPISKYRFLGDVCAKHPELKGERSFGSYKCIGCKREESRLAREERKKKGSHYKGKVCPLHPELEGKRYSSSGSCTKCELGRFKDRRYKRKGYNIVDGTKT